MIAGDPSLTSDAAQLCIYALATVAAGAIGFGIRSLYKFGKTQGVIHEQIMGRPATDARPGIPSLEQRFETVGAHLSRQDSKLDVLEHEVQTNGGSSLKDDVKAARGEIQTVAARVECIDGKVDSVTLKLDGHIAQVARNQTARKRTTRSTPAKKAPAKKAVVAKKVAAK